MVCNIAQHNRRRLLLSAIEKSDSFVTYIILNHLDEFVEGGRDIIFIVKRG